MIFILPLSLREKYVHLPSPNGSVPLSTMRDVQSLVTRVIVPPGCTSDLLPAVTNPEKWDNGATGLQYQISHGMGDVEYQLESTIDSILADYPDARQIARECLYKSKRFIMELYSFISQDYQKWKHWCHSNKEAWKMTTVCVRRIFEEIHSEHVIAKDVYDQSNKDFTTAHSLWATWKAHNVMAKYLKHQFYEHPSISAVLA